MSDLSDTIKGFYSDFILRDLLSFVTPGAIVVGTFILGFYDLDSIKKISVFIWILLFGFFYIVGIGLQYCRECMPDLKFPPVSYHSKYRDIDKKINPDEKNGSKPVDDKNQFQRDFGYDEDFRNAKYYQEFRLPFIKTAREKDSEKKIHERFIVIMQASGNSAIAFLIAGISALVIGIIRFGYQISSHIIIFALLCAVLTIVLWKNFEIHRQRVIDWEFETIKFNDP